MSIPQELWPEPEQAHPTARQLLREEFFWDQGDDNSPHGNDGGADTFLAFHQWMLDNPGVDSSVYLEEELNTWSGVDWDCLDEAEILKFLEWDYSTLLAWDDMLISLAFGQLILEGRVLENLKEKALMAIKRQTLPTVIAFREWVDPEERVQRLKIMENVLNQV